MTLELGVGKMSPIANDGPPADDGTEAQSRRRDTRHGICTDAAVRNVFGVRASGTMTDVSPHGCQIQIRSGYLREGQFVSIRINGLEPWVGVVRWGDFKNYGIEFSTPLYGPIVEHLAKSNPVVQID
jgi:hypothetical protein